MISRSAALVLAPALLAATAFPALAADSSTPDAGASKIRVVRLSESKGAVLMDRAIGRGFEHAMANMPIVEGSSLRTDQGVAEVEFEDNSSLRRRRTLLLSFQSWNGWRRAPLYRRCDWCAARLT